MWVMFTLLIVVVFGVPSYLLYKNDCSTFAELQNTEYKFTIGGECYVNLNGEWITKDRWYFLQSIQSLALVGNEFQRRKAWPEYWILERRKVSIAMLCTLGVPCKGLLVMRSSTILIRCSKKSNVIMFVSNIASIYGTRLELGEVTVADLLALDGKDLVCWCAPARCHGDTIMKAIEWAKKQRA